MSKNITIPSMSSTQGFTMPGEIQGDNSGSSVSSAGDFNKDGYGDVIIGAIDANSPAPGFSGTGKSYIIFGNPNIGSSSTNLTALSNTQGVTIFGENNGDQSGFSVSNAGDFNKDGYTDVIIGAPGANGVAGISYVVFGSSQNVGTINLASLGTQGFRILGENGSNCGYAVSGAGDVNGDGYADIIIGAPFANNHAGKSYVIFGNNGTLSDINLSALSSAQGFSILGEASSDESGCAVSSLGDFNKDGYDDIIIGARFGDITTTSGHASPGKSYIIFGGANIGASNINLSTMSNAQGFRIIGESDRDKLGISVSGAGDFNKDGYADAIIGAFAPSPNFGKSYVIFGHAGAVADITLSALKNTQGFKILGEQSGDQSGCSVSSAGDFNKDGYSDVIIGANVASSSAIANDYTGKSYIIFGHGGLASNVNLFTLNNQGIVIIGGKDDEIGNSVSRAGDMNGDGYADVIIGASTAFIGAGKSSVIFGDQYTVETPLVASASISEAGLPSIMVAGLLTACLEF